MPRILYFFALCNLVIGSGAFVLSGILQPLSHELGISVAASGQVMTAYAIATAVLAPVLIFLTAKSAAAPLRSVPEEAAVGEVLAFLSVLVGMTLAASRVSPSSDVTI